MGDTYVDVSYRGLELGKRVKLRDVRPDAGYLEHPLPMPVGTRVDIVADDGVTIAATVVAIHEQVAGEAMPPGMRVQPALDAAAAPWWQARIDGEAMAAEAAAKAQAEAEAAARAQAEADAIAAAQARAAAVAQVQAEIAPTVPMAPVVDAAAPVDAAPAAPVDAAPAAPTTPDAGAAVFAQKAKGKKGDKSGSRATTVMSAAAVEEAVRASLATPDDAPDDGLADDGRRTEAMAAIDPEALGVDASAPAAPAMDDGKRTTVMSAIDVSMITGVAPADLAPAVDGDEDSAEITIEAGDGEGDEEGASKSGKIATDGAGGAKKKRKRKKR